MSSKNIPEILKQQKEFFSSNQTKNINFRIKQLKILKLSIQNNYQNILSAFLKDYNKCEFDVITTEIGMVYAEIDYFIKHLKKLAKPKNVRTSILTTPSKAKIYYEPFGQVLIMSPWNYPFQLAMIPLADAIAGGNTIVLKPSAYAPNVSAVIEQILKVFEPNYISVVLGGREENQELLDNKFDLIFFTGSKTVGKVVQEKASKHLCPVILELGGKSPCIVNYDADLKTAVKRIVWGKFLNAGQTCIAPDYIFVHKNIYETFIQNVKNLTKNWYYNENGDLNSDFPYIINDKSVARIEKLIDKNKLVFGGKIKGRCIEPTILKDVSYDDPVMQEEIFGPIMPILPFDNLQEVYKYINNNDKPLALYYFGKDKNTINEVINNTTSGGVCINETIMHFVEKGLAFGGVGESGMGKYHGKHSFETFTHAKSVLFKNIKLGFDIQYPPITKKKQSLIKFIMKIK